MTSLTDTRQPGRRAALCVVACGAALLLPACSGGEDQHSGGAPAPETYLGLPAEKPQGLTVLDDPPIAPWKLVPSTHPDKVWIGSTDGLGWIDPDNNRIHLVDRKPGVYIAIQGQRLYRAAWSYDNVAVYDIAGQPRELSRHRAPSPLNITAGPAGVWAADHNHGHLLRLDPDTAKVAAKVPIGTGPGLGPAGMVWVGDHLWVNSKRDGNLCEVAGHSGRTLACVHITDGDIGDDVALTSSGIWAAVGDPEQGDPWRVLFDPERRQIVARQMLLDPTRPPTSLGLPVAVGHDIWVPSGQYLIHLSPELGFAPDRVLQLPLALNEPATTVAFGSLWISSPVPHPVVMRIDEDQLTAP